MGLVLAAMLAMLVIILAGGGWTSYRGWQAGAEHRPKGSRP